MWENRVIDQYLAEELKTFVKLNEIKHTIPPEDLLISRALCPKFHTSYEK